MYMSNIAMNLKCYHCQHEWKSKLKEGYPKLCPHCGRDWRKPTLKHRVFAAIEAFKCEPVHRKRTELLKDSPFGTYTKVTSNIPALFGEDIETSKATQEIVNEQS
jgi:hypothetical protein